MDFDGEIETQDWRSSASIVGLIQYLDFFNCQYDYELNLDMLYYHKMDITEDRYLKFVEYQYANDMHHTAVKNLLEQETFTEEVIKEINVKLTANSIMKKHFSKLKFDGENRQEILAVIDKNRKAIIKETYRNKLNLYQNFANPNLLFTEPNTYCRLVGYYVDGPKKGKSVAYHFDKGTYISRDLKEYDFIPFAFTIGREALFINDNSSIKDLIATNSKLKSVVKRAMEESNKPNPDVRKAFFQAIIESSDYIDYDVEVIVKNQENSYFETLFLRKKSIQILKNIKDFGCFCFWYKDSKIDDYLNIQREVTNAITNLTSVEYLIELFIKEDNQSNIHKWEYLIQRLIEVNVRIYGGEAMFLDIKQARDCAKSIVQNEKLLNPQKIKSYRTKLSSALVFKDYKRYCDVLIQLANYTGVELDFAYKLFENFEKHKEIAYTFVNALGSGVKDKEDEEYE